MHVVRVTCLLMMTTLALAGAGCGRSEDRDFGLSATPDTRLERLRELGVSSFQRRFTVYHSAGCEKRADELCQLLEEMLGFYETGLRLRPELSVAVLNRADWQRVEPGIPYGIPSVSPAPHVVLLPATHDGIVVQDILNLRHKASPATLRKIEQSGFTFERGAERLIDLIALHELGHVLTLAYGIHPPSRWSNEFLATYFAQAFLRETRPRLANLFVALTQDLQFRDGDRPTYTSLEDFDRLYSQVGSANYGWYQSFFMQRVERVYEMKGLAFLEKVRSAYPAGTKNGEPAVAVLERLEQICPGFLDWAASVGAPGIK